MAKRPIPQPNDAESQAQPAPEAFRYTGSNPEYECIAGVPACDLDAQTFRALIPELQARVRASAWYAPATAGE